MTAARRAAVTASDVSPPLTPRRVLAAVAALRAADPKMAAANDRVGPCTLRPRAEGTHFDHLARAIVYQQLSGAAAATIYGRFVAHGGGSAPSPEQLLAIDDDTLRACGLSRAKILAIRDLARCVLEGRLPMDALEQMSDAAVVDALVQVRGIGPWTAQMFLMFRLWRPDVLPVLDLGVRKGAQVIYRMRSLPDAARLERVARNWRPWASIGSWYCWRILDTNDGGW